MTRAQRVTRRRLHVCFLLVVVIFSVFGLRLFQIQGVDTKAYAAQAVAAGTRQVTVPAERGEIVDRNGTALASSVAGATLTADPSMTARNAPRIARILVTTLGSRVDYFELVDQLRTPKSRYVTLARQVPAYRAKKAVSAVAKADLPGVFSTSEAIRSYPGSTLAANLLGYLNGEGKGVAGLEQEYDDVLTGTDGSTTFEMSPTGQRIPQADRTVKEMVPGDDVVTTIDSDLQYAADQRLRKAVHSSSADWGLAVTMDVKTGQLVQMSQYPTFDPGDRSTMTSDTTVPRAFTNVYEPGSVQKTLTMAALADQGKIDPDSRIVVPNKIKVDEFTIGDYWEHGTLHLTAVGVIALSSNMGTVVAAEQMSNSVMHDYLAKFGLGSKTGVEVPSESNGILPATKSWTKASKATISFGQGVSVTAMQMIRAVGAIANGGVMVQPTVVSGTRDADGAVTRTKTAEGKRVVSQDAAAKVTRMMEAVTADDGTAPMAQIEGYRVAGKTGTAWRVDPDTGRYIKGQNTVSFMGFAPADEPRFITYVVLDKPNAGAGGGSTAAPVFHDIMSMALERFGVAPTGAKSPKVAQEW